MPDRNVGHTETPFEIQIMAVGSLVDLADSLRTSSQCRRCSRGQVARSTGCSSLTLWQSGMSSGNATNGGPQGNGHCCQCDGTANGTAEDIWEVWWCYDGWHPIADRLEKLLPAWARLHRMDPSRPLSQQVRNAKVLVPTTGDVNRETIFAARDLQIIVQPASGYNNIDIQAARERGVPITLAHGVNSQATAEIALCLMLMLSRRIDEARVAFSNGIIGEPVGRKLHGKTLGVVGMGRVGKCLAEAAQGLGMKVLGVDSKSSRSDLEHLLSHSDVVSLHTPLNSTTEGLISHKELALMQPHALLINCARGAVVDKAALWEALCGGRLGGVGLDCHWVEPADPTEPLYKHPKVIALPHLGVVAEEVYNDFAAILATNIVRKKNGEPLINELCIA